MQINTLPIESILPETVWNQWLIRNDEAACIVRKDEEHPLYLLIDRVDNSTSIFKLSVREQGQHDPSITYIIDSGGDNSRGIVDAVLAVIRAGAVLNGGFNRRYTVYFPVLFTASIELEAMSDSEALSIASAEVERGNIDFDFKSTDMVIEDVIVDHANISVERKT